MTMIKLRLVFAMGDIFVNNNKTNIFQSGSNENNFFVQQESFQTNDMATETLRQKEL